MKGQQEALSAILISGILIGVVGSVYFWGVPLIQKNKDISILESSEAFVRGLDVKIKSVANNGGRDQMSIPVPGIVTFDGKMITMSIENVELRNAATLRDFRIALTGPPASGGQDKTIIIDSLGDSTTVNNGRTLISINVKISII